MKKVFYVISITFLTVSLFFSCKNETPQVFFPITLDLQADKTINLSAFNGRHAFLVVTNNNNASTQIFNSSQSSYVNTINNEDKLDNDCMHENQMQITNIPFEAPKVDIPLVIDDAINANRSLNASSSSTNYEIGDTRDFYGANEDNQTRLYGKDSVLKAIGNHCYVWYKEKEGITVTDYQLQKLADTFDSIYEKETFLFGNTYDPNCNYSNIINIKTEEKIHLIVYDLLNDYTEGQNSGTFGYFWSLDYFTNEDDAEESYMSNECQCLHLDSYFLQIAEEYMLSTIPHEFQHLLHFVNKTVKHASSTNSNTFRFSSSWFNEMMSMICEDIMQSQLEISDQASPKSRLSTFNSSYMYGFTTWLDDAAVGISYANAYAFGAYLVRNFGIDFIRELSQNDYIDQDAITMALQAKNCSLTTFDQAYENFYKAIVFPVGNSYTLNKSATQTYTIGENSVTFVCTPINLYDYIAIYGEDMTSSKAKQLFNAKAGTNYYGPVILNAQYYYSNLYPHGMSVSYWGMIGSNILPSNFTLSSNFATWNSGVKYRLYIGF